MIQVVSRLTRAYKADGFATWTPIKSSIHSERLSSSHKSLQSSEKQQPDGCRASSAGANSIGLAQNKQQSEFAAEILPMAQQLLEISGRAGLTRSSNTDKGQVTAFEGQNYSMRCREKGDKQEFKVLCHRSSGLIYAVNGEPQKSQGLLKSDKATFARYASMTPTQFN